MQNERDNKVWRRGYDAGRDGSPLEGLSGGFSRDFGGRDGGIYNAGLNAGAKDKEKFGPRRSETSLDDFTQESLEGSVESSDSNSSSRDLWSDSRSSSSYSNNSGSNYALLKVVGLGVLALGVFGIIMDPPRKKLPYAPVIYKEASGKVLGTYPSYEDSAWGIFRESFRSECDGVDDGRITQCLEFLGRYSKARKSGEEGADDSIDAISYSGMLYRLLVVNERNGGFTPSLDIKILNAAIGLSHDKDLPDFTNSLQYVKKRYIDEVNQGCDW